MSDQAPERTPEQILDEAFQTHAWWIRAQTRRDPEEGAPRMAEFAAPYQRLCWLIGVGEFVSRAVGAWPAAVLRLDAIDGPARSSRPHQVF